MSQALTYLVRRTAGANLLALAGLAMAGSFTLAAEPPAGTVSITVTDKGCVPSTLTVAAGKTTFRITNASRRALEWEILKGVDVVAERENIVPGFVQPLSATLTAGEYQMTCGLLSNPKGVLHVTGPVGTSVATAAPAADLAGPLAEYKAYVTNEVNALVESTRAFVLAVKANDIAKARELYAPTRQHYERIEPIAELFNDLDKSIDARADDFEQKEQDPTWGGFHRIEKVLFADSTTTGMTPVADKLLADTEELQKRLGTLTITPKAMLGGPAELIEEIAATKISGEEDRYSHTDLWDFQANVDGAQKIVSLLRSMVQSRNPRLLTKLDGNFTKVDAILAKYRQGNGYRSYQSVSDADRKALKGPITALAEDLAELPGTLQAD
jgi:iron uptake system component EfeO